MAESHVRIEGLYNTQMAFINVGVQNKIIFARVAYSIFNLSYNIDALQTIKQILFPDKI